MSETFTELNAGSGGSKMDESLVPNAAAGGDAHRVNVATGGADGSLQTYEAEDGRTKADVKDVSALAQLAAISAELSTHTAAFAAILAELDQKTAPTDTQPVTGPLTDAELRASAVPVTATSLPLPTGASTEATLALIQAKTDNLDVALSTRTKPSDTQLVDGSAVTQPISAAALPLPSGAATEAGLASILARQADGTQHTLVDNFPESQVVTGPLTDAELRASPPAVRDRYTTGEALADQDGAGAALTFTFMGGAVDLLWVRCDGGDGRADPFGGTPDVVTGIICEDGIPQPITLVTSSVKVYAEAGTSVSVWGFRY